MSGCNCSGRCKVWPYTCIGTPYCSDNLHRPLTWDVQIQMDTALLQARQARIEREFEWETAQHNERMERVNQQDDAWRELAGL